MHDHNEKKEIANIKAILVGLALIILIAVVTIFKSNSTKPAEQKTNQSPAQAETIDLEKINQITSEELIEGLQADTNITVIDIRSENQYQQEHIIGSINIPSSNFASFSSIVSKNDTCVIIDASGETAVINAIANNLASKGYKNLAYLVGGFDSWKSKFNPTISNGDQKSFTDQAKVNYITAEELKKRLETEKNLIIIDIRNSADFHSEHLAGAINIPLDNLEQKRKEIPAGRNIIIYDKATPEAFKGAVRLFDLGFSNTLVLTGGLDGWKKNGYETMK
ncbi:MAG: rhodanese-like domain-containing protein [Candidatus Moraniibacteriota bacterium]